MSLHSSSTNPVLLRERVLNLELLPPHDPNRFESLDGFDDPNTTNAKRVGFTIDALVAFQKTSGERGEPRVVVADLICDLLHLVHSFQDGPQDVLENALTHFIAEAG